MTQTLKAPSKVAESKEDAITQLLRAAEDNHTKPLWAQMTRLNPPLPNPQCIPHVWKYNQIRPQLLQAGELVTEKQAERRVLMLVNPNRGEEDPWFLFSRSSHQLTFLRKMPHIPPIPSMAGCSLSCLMRLPPLIDTQPSLAASSLKDRAGSLLSTANGSRCRGVMSF